MNWYISQNFPQHNGMEKTKSKNCALVIGGSSGIGYHTCLKLVNKGYKVLNISRTPCKNEKVTNIPADVANDIQYTEALHTATAAGGISVLVYCAGCSMMAPIEYAKESDYRYLFEVNFFAALKAMQTLIPQMKVGGGRMVFVGSLGGELPVCFDSFYSASKAALEMLCREAYTELKGYNIAVTGVLPGGTATNFTFKRKIYSGEDSKSYSRNVNKAVTALANMEQSGMAPEAVADIILNILAEDKPPVIRVCGAKNTMFRLFSRVMPEKVTLKLNERMYNQ